MNDLEYRFGPELIPGMQNGIGFKFLKFNGEALPEGREIPQSVVGIRQSETEVRFPTADFSYVVFCGFIERRGHISLCRRQSKKFVLSYKMGSVLDEFQGYDLVF